MALGSTSSTSTVVVDQRVGLMALPHDTESVVVGRIGRAHGIKGEVSVEPRTDEPDRRFAVGNALDARVPGGDLRPGALTVTGLRWHQGRLLLRFAEFPDRTAAEAARGTLLEVQVDADEAPTDPEEFYDRQLIGLVVRTTDGREIGPISSVIHGAAQDILAIKADGREVLVPFVTELVPEVDIAGGYVVVADRPGLLDGDPR
ncbi:MAG: ribosome maturation factor RimM [Marmoricola sp.]